MAFQVAVVMRPHFYLNPMRLVTFIIRAVVPVVVVVVVVVRSPELGA